MVDRGSSESEQQEMHKKHALEIASAVLIALATVASAWSAYQATRWSGVQSISFNEAAALRAEATRKTNIATQRVEIDVGMFVQYAAAFSGGRKIFADFLFQRFRPELKAAAEAWIKTRPQKNPDAPSSPFKMKEYSVKELDEANVIIENAEQRTVKGKDANQTGDNYVLVTVLFTLVLFFAGVGTKFDLDVLKVIMLSSAAAIYVVGIIFLLKFSVH